MSAIERQLDLELAEWTEKTEQARISYEQALAYLACMTPMSRMDGAELKRTYRVLAKRLHPDVRGANSEERSALFVLAQSAYRNGDVEALHALEVATRHMDAAEDDLEATDDVELLAQELELVRIEEGVVRERLNNLERGPELRLVVHDRQGSREQGLRLARGVDYRPAEGAYYEQNGTQLRMALRSRE